MATDASGNYSLPNDPASNIIVGGVPVSDATALRAVINDIANALTERLTRNGKGAMLADLDHGGFKAKNIAYGTDPNDAAAFGQLMPIILSVVRGEMFYRATISGGSTANALILTVNGLAALSSSPQRIELKLTQANTGNMTVSFDGGTTYLPLYAPDGTQIGAGVGVPGVTYEIDVTNTQAIIVRGA